ncbi:MAG: type II toxin-antitoxin system PemK/MazF family toxin [SAR202 cluster bacterium]|nr:type II toxin-antitoxin system PemK/MazF family toxin [SAR202 cluster bacterium]
MKGKIVLLPFPFDDLAANKVRPALCLTRPIGANSHIVVAFITSKAPPDPQPSDIFIDPHMPGNEVSGLKVPSTVRLHRLMTISTSGVQRELGLIPVSNEAEVNAKLRKLFGLAAKSR